MIAFRNLHPHEIDVRVSRCIAKGAVFLLYKDARCDMSILDETVGPQNWQRRHEEHNGNLFCSVGINANFDDPSAPPMWVWKEDAGAESNTEAEKGHASDSFKRACVNWGIGRELYTKIFIFIPGITKSDNGKYTLADPFFKLTVEHIAYEDKKIIELVLCDKTGVIAFDMNRRVSYSNGLEAKQKREESPPPKRVNKIPPKEDDTSLPWDDAISCEGCGLLILPYESRGRTYSPETLAAKSKEKYGEVLCKACAEARSQRENAG